MQWVRTETDEYPKTYVKFEGRKVDENGKRRHYWVQDLTVDMVDNFIDGFVNGFAKDELMCRTTKMYESEEDVSQFKEFQRENFKKKVSLICLTKDDQGVDKVVGLNSLYVKQRGDEDMLNDGDDSAPMRVLKHLYAQRDPFKEFGTDKYVNAFGLFVFPEFRGEGVAVELLKARRFLCQDLGITTTLTYFSSYISQGAAEKAGFKDYVRIDYDKFPEGMVVPGLSENTQSARLMYIKY